MNYVYGVIFIVVLSVSGYCYKLYTDNIVLKANQIEMEKAIDEQYRVIVQNKKDFENIQSINEGYRTLNENSEKRISELNSVFTKEKTSTVIIDNKEYKIQVKRDIGKLAVKKPKLIQNAINRGALDSFVCFETITDPNFTNFKDLKGDKNVCK